MISLNTLCLPVMGKSSCLRDVLTIIFVINFVMAKRRLFALSPVIEWDNMPNDQSKVPTSEVAKLHTGVR